MTNNNNVVRYILLTLELDQANINQSKKVNAANNFEKVFKKLDNRENVVKNTIFRYIQRIAMSEPYHSFSQTVEAIKYASWEMYKIKKNTSEEYQKILNYLQETYPVE